MKNFFGIAGLSVVITSCLNSVESSDMRSRVEPEAQRTVLAYLIGENGSSELSPFLKNDFVEMCEGMADVDDSRNNLLVYSQSRSDDPHLIQIRKEEGVVIADTLFTYDTQNPLEYDIMSSVVNDVKTKFPAKSYGLILASHGEGWYEGSASSRWFGDYKGHYMDIKTLRDVLSNFPVLDFILFDASYMQSVEVSYELQDCARYIISSPTEIPGSGAPYHTIVPKMFADKSDVAIDIAREYYTYYENIYDKPGQWRYGAAVSAVKTSELKELATLTKNILTSYLLSDQEIDTSSLLYYDGSSKRYYYDFAQFMGYITDESSDYNKWYKVFDKVCPYYETTQTNYVQQKLTSKFDMTGSQGLSINLPRANAPFNSYYRTLKWFNESGWKEAGF